MSSFTAGDLIDACLAELQGDSLDEQQATTLTGSISPSDLTFTVSSIRGIAEGLSVGVIEIDSELLYVTNVATDGSNLVTVASWGRGVKGTTATAHTAGAKVTSAPTFPRARVLQRLNETIDRVYPEVFAVKSYETTTTFPQMTYSLPSDAERALTIHWQVPDSTNYWQTVRRWRNSPGGGTLTGDTSRSVDVGDNVMPGRPMQILYVAKPAHLVTEADDFVDITGLHVGMKDVIYTGAAAALTISQELSRLQVSSVEQQNRSQLVAPSAALTSSSLLDRRYQARLLEERKVLQQLYPPRITGVWR